MREYNWITPSELIGQYDALLFDAFGVLINHSGPMDGAPSLISHLNKEDKAYFVVTNDASRSPEDAATWYRDNGLDISGNRVISSATLLKPFFTANQLVDATTVVLGPAGSQEMATRAGAEVVDWSTETDFEVLAICDEFGFPFPEALDHVISLLFRMWDRGKQPILLLVNPDFIYPQREGHFGIAAGSIAALIRAAVLARYPDRSAPLFIQLGKPHAPIFAEAARRAGTRSLVMIGDQIATDIRGAQDFGIDSVLMTTGVERVSDISSEYRPTYCMNSLRLSQAKAL
jgi:HAD superfamily hydrolase (TIGR01450 family)